MGGTSCGACCATVAVGIVAGTVTGTVACGSSGVLPASIGSVHGGKGGSSEVGVRGTSSGLSLFGVPNKEAEARGPVPFEGVAPPPLPLLALALNAWRREPWHGSVGVSDPVGSRGATRLVGVESRDFGVLLLLFDPVPLSLLLLLLPAIALSGAGVAKKKAASDWGGGPGIELVSTGC